MNTGGTPSLSAAEALDEYRDINDWQVEGIKRALASLDRGESIAHAQIKKWAASLGKRNRRQTKHIST